MRQNEAIQWISPSGEAITVAAVGTPVHLDEVRGLDGLEQDIYTVKGSGQAGLSVAGATLMEREIEITVSIARNHVPYRRALLRAFRPASTPGTLVFRRGEESWHISAYVETAPVFELGVLETGTITLLCPSPALLAGDADATGSVDIAEWIDDIEFDFEIPAEGHTLAHRAPQLIVDVYNDGDLEAGARIMFAANGAAKNPSLVNVQTQEKISLTITLQAGDLLEVNTAYGKKRVTLTRDGAQSNVFNLLDAGSTWMQMHPGDNFLRFAADEGTDNLDVRIYSSSAYSGV